MIVGDIWLIFVNRSWKLPLRSSLLRPNSALWWVIGCTLFILVLALFVPAVSELFHFEVVNWSHLTMTVVFAGVTLTLLSCMRFFRPRT
jgi:Ca2+-transporting ATPase